MGVIRSAAPTDPDIDVLWNRIQTDFYDNQRSIVQSLDQKNALRPDLDVDRATDILWTLNHPDPLAAARPPPRLDAHEYEQWFADTTCSQLLGSRRRRRVTTEAPE